MTYVLQLAKDSSFAFNDGFLRSLHFMMLYYDLTKHPGNWRPGPIYVRDEAKEANVYEAHLPIQFLNLLQNWLSTLTAHGIVSMPLSRQLWRISI